jgi:predicted GNAT family N-acyltransferase
MAGHEDIRLVVGDWSALGKQATAIRHEVFVLEQQVPLELELDEMDAVSLHVVAYSGEQAIGTARLLPDGHIGRMAVRAAYRGAGAGSRLLMILVQTAQARGDRVLRLNAQRQAEAFYARHGFVQEGEEFLDAGIPHIAMRYAFLQGFNPSADRAGKS